MFLPELRRVVHSVASRVARSNAPIEFDLNLSVGND